MIEAINNTISQINTDSGSAIGSAKGTVNINGSNGITTQGFNNTVLIKQSNFIWVSPIQRVSWDTAYGSMFLSSGMNAQGPTWQEVSLLQPYSGKVTMVSFYPISDNFNGTVMITLYNNGMATNQTIAITENNFKPQLINLNYNFNKNDNLVWRIVSSIPNQQSIVFNVKVVIQYNR